MLYFKRQAEATASHLVTRCSQGLGLIHTLVLKGGFFCWVERVADAIRFLHNNHLIGGVTPLARN